MFHHRAGARPLQLELATMSRDPDYDYWVERIRDWLERAGAAPHEIENVINDCLYDPWFRSINLASH